MINGTASAPIRASADAAYPEVGAFVAIIFVNVGASGAAFVPHIVIACSANPISVGEAFVNRSPTAGTAFVPIVPSATAAACPIVHEGSRSAATNSGIAFVACGPNVCNAIAALWLSVIGDCSCSFTMPRAHEAIFLTTKLFRYVRTLAAFRCASEFVRNGTAAGPIARIAARATRCVS